VVFLQRTEKAILNFTPEDWEDRISTITCATRYNKTNMKPAFAADAARQRSEHDLGIHAEVFQSGVQRMGSATATSVMWVGHEFAGCR
jgi:hypothetical protein